MKTMIEIMELVSEKIGQKVVRTEISSEREGFTQYEFYVEDGRYCIVNRKEFYTMCLKRTEIIWSIGWENILKEII